MREKDTLFAKDSAAWRAWLKKNYKTSNEIWLIFYKKHTDIECVSYDSAVEEAICFGWIDSILKRVDGEKYIQKFTPRKKNSMWSALNISRAERMIRQKKMTKHGLSIYFEGLSNKNKKVKIEIPVEFSEDIYNILKYNTKANDYFNSLPPSLKKQYAMWVMTAKKEETQKRRVKELISYLEKGQHLPLK
ncbi:MAG: YdeI/OmpD-associated family protein [bacterium]|nr:YdeI/OmpD-associated family protein [bacterium]